MRTRRSYLTIISGAVAASLAGCLGSDNNGIDAYENALSLLDENKHALNEFAESEHVTADFNEREINRRADSADDYLDEAEESLSDDDQELVDNARLVADYQRRVADYNALIVEFDGCFNTAEAYIDSERFSSASEKLDECQDISDEMQLELETVEEAHTLIDVDLLEEDAQFDHEQVGDDIQVEREEHDLVESLIDGLQYMLEGMESFMEGMDQYDNENFNSAVTTFRNAEEAFDDGEEEFGLLEADPNTPEQYRPDAIELHCIVESFYDASGHFADSSSAAANQDWGLAEQHADEGVNALERCE